jgi:uncharacterized protein DUF3311
MKIKILYILLALLILIPATVNLAVPLYNIDLPELLGMPFFYWFQTIWLVFCSGFYLSYAYILKKEEEKKLGTELI